MHAKSTRLNARVHLLCSIVELGRFGPRYARGLEGSLSCEPVPNGAAPEPCERGRRSAADAALVRHGGELQAHSILEAWLSSPPCRPVVFSLPLPAEILLPDNDNGYFF